MSRILFVITQSEIGGAQRYLLKLVKYLNAKGYEINVAAGEGDGELFQKLNSIPSGSDPDGIGVRPQQIKVASLVRSLNPLEDIRALLAILKLIKSEQPDVLFLQSTKAGFLGSLAAKLLKSDFNKPKIIYRIGGWAFRDPRAWWMNKILFWMEKISAPWKDVIIVNSEFDKQLAMKKKIAQADKIVKIYNGIDANSINFLSKEEARKKFSIFNFSARGESAFGGQFSITPETKIVGTIANLYATKGLEYLIESANRLRASSFKFHVSFVIIGEGKERKKLESLIKKYKLENRFFLVGRVANAARYLKAFDLFVLPSVKEGFPWVLLEAMAANVPIVATNVGAIPEIIENEKEGVLVPPRDSDKLAKSITKLMNNTDFANKLADNALKKLTHFSKDMMLEESERIINESKNPTRE